MNTSPTVVIKVGTSSICDEKTFIPKLANLSLLVETISELLSNGYKVVLVTSGAIGVGLRRLKLSKKPKKMCTIQGIAAVGQVTLFLKKGRLMALYDALFTQYDIPIGQILLTRENLTLVCYI
jgi:glutamate 5-kinase